jgi:hypothetical protein
MAASATSNDSSIAALPSRGMLVTPDDQAQISAHKSRAARTSAKATSDIVPPGK